MPVSLALSPQGHLLIDDWVEEIFCFPETLAGAAAKACENGNGAVLLWLAGLAAAG